jgi:hypothetical protein
MEAQRSSLVCLFIFHGNSNLLKYFRALLNLNYLFTMLNFLNYFLDLLNL